MPARLNQIAAMGGKLEIELGKRIKDLREKAHLSQAELAQLAQKSVETISNFERGKTLPSIRTLAGLAKHLECGVADFFTAAGADKPERDQQVKAMARKLKLVNAEDRVLLAQIAEILARRSRR